MDEQTTPKRVRRVGSIAFALVLIAAGVLLIVYQFVPQFDLLKILKFSPVILIALGIEMLVYSARPDVKVKFDWLAMLGTAFTLCIVGTAALLPLAISEWGPARNYAQTRIESQKADAMYSALTPNPALKAKTDSLSVDVWFNHDTDGDYTLLTLGNAESPLAFEAGDRTLATLEMELAGLTPSGEYLDADELYWGVCRMHVDGSRQQTFTTYMNNIHCHLHVKVMWHNMPEDVGAYRMEIGQVPVGYSLCPDRCHTVGDKLIPAGNGKLATHVERTPLKAQELRGEFVTMRYTAEHIPVFRLWFGDKAVTEPIDLRRAFRTWGWNPDAAAVQEYRIQLTLFADGSVEVRPWIDADVEDWQDGGTFN